MKQKEFAERATKIWSRDKSFIGLAVAGSWLTNEIDEFSDLDLIVVTEEKITEKLLGASSTNAIQVRGKVNLIRVCPQNLY